MTQQPTIEEIHTTDDAEAAWLVVDNFREPLEYRVPAAIALLDWMNETGECPHPMGHRTVTELNVVWVCAGVLQKAVQS